MSNVIKCADCGRPFSTPTRGGSKYCPACRHNAITRNGRADQQHVTIAAVEAGAAAHAERNEERARRLICGLPPAATAAILEAHRLVLA